LAYQVICQGINVTDDAEQKKVLDCSGLCCSLPLVEARTELDKMERGQTLEVVATCPSAENDMKALTRIEGFELVRKWKEDDRFHFLIKKV
jgi:tRNA 2-thiouridine synthesizing protein A